MQLASGKGLPSACELPEACRGIIRLGFSSWNYGNGNCGSPAAVTAGILTSDRTRQITSTNSFSRSRCGRYHVSWRCHPLRRCLDHSAGKSVRRATPMPYGSRPSMAALPRSGARKASEIVMLTFRTLQPSRSAMWSVVMDASVVSSSSQRRPRAMATTNVARVSDRIGRACCGGVPSGRRISRTGCGVVPVLP